MYPETQQLVYVLIEKKIYNTNFEIILCDRYDKNRIILNGTMKKHILIVEIIYLRVMRPIFFRYIGNSRECYNKSC
jgi:hypothetical protein